VPGCHGIRYSHGSYGGSDNVFVFMAIGLVMNVRLSDSSIRPGLLIQADGFAESG